MAGVFEYLSYDEYYVLGKEINGEFYHFKCYVIREAYHKLLATHWLVRVQGVGEDIPNNMFLLSTLNR